MATCFLRAGSEEYAELNGTFGLATLCGVYLVAVAGIELLFVGFNVVFDLADRVQVLRLGRVAGVREIAATTKDEVIALITGSLSDQPVEELA